MSDKKCIFFSYLILIRGINRKQLFENIVVLGNGATPVPFNPLLRMELVKVFYLVPYSSLFGHHCTAYLRSRLRGASLFTQMGCKKKKSVTFIFHLGISQVIEILTESTMTNVSRKCAA